MVTKENYETQNKKNLPESYYLNNFLSLINYVRTNYDDLINSDELAFADNFSKLGNDAKKLYVRLISRKGLVFRLDKLDYKEIKNLKDCCRELVAASYIEINPNTTKGTQKNISKK